MDVREESGYWGGCLARLRSGLLFDVKGLRNIRLIQHEITPEATSLILSVKWR